MTHPVIFFRGSHAEEEEFLAAQKYFDVVEFRTAIPDHSLVIPRYSALPFYQELEKDINHIGGRLINTYAQHQYIADIRNYYPDLQAVTFPTYTRWNNLPDDCSYVVKGITNSRKHNWKEQMFAPTKDDVPRIVHALLQDELISQQGVVVRKFIPLKKLGDGINGLPVSNEWRFFFLNQELVTGNFYWASEPDLRPDKFEACLFPDAAYQCAANAIKLMSVPVPFTVVDVAETADGQWIVVELNDGQMSGLSTIDPDLFYSLLRKRF